MILWNNQSQANANFDPTNPKQAAALAAAATTAATATTMKLSRARELTVRNGFTLEHSMYVLLDRC